jgi:hypothetical protein
METQFSSETSVDFLQTTRRCILEDNSSNIVSIILKRAKRCMKSEPHINPQTILQEECSEPVCL